MKIYIAKNRKVKAKRFSNLGKSSVKWSKK